MNSLMLCLLVLLGMSILSIIFLFRKNHWLKSTVSQSSINYLQPKQSGIVAGSRLHTKIALVNHFTDIPYGSALEQDGLNEVMVRNSMEPIEAMFRYALPNVPNGVRIVDSIVQTNEGIVFNLSEAGKTLLKTGKAEIMKTADGTKWLPQIRGVEDKKIIELFKAKDISKLSSIAKNLPKLANAAVAVSNIISNIDLAKKLEKIDKKVNFLIAGRQIDKKGELEGCYRLVSEIKLIYDQEDWNPKLYDVHHKLLTLRSIWKNEIEYILENVKDPNDKFFSRVFRTKKSKDKEVINEVTEFEELFYLFDFTVKFDTALCSAIKYPLALKEDIRAVNGILGKISNIKTVLSNKNPDYSLDEYDKHLNSCKENYGHFEELCELSLGQEDNTIPPAIENRIEESSL